MSDEKNDVLQFTTLINPSTIIVDRNESEGKSSETMIVISTAETKKSDVNVIYFYIPLFHISFRTSHGTF